MQDAFDGCSDSCGWIAAFVAMLAYGTYGVPIKESRHVEVHPLIFQTYKTAVMLLTCPAVLLLGVAPSFTPWGILSGALWVLGGTGGVVAVRLAGMATAVGTWASVMIGVNFVWGILVFREPVARVENTLAAFLLLGGGLIGMSRYGAPAVEEHRLAEGCEAPNVEMKSLVTHYPQYQSNSSKASSKSTTLLRRSRSDGDANAVDDDDEADRLDNTCTEGEAPPSFNQETHVRVCGVVIRKRAAGIGGAVWNGLMAGSSLIPLHYAKQHGYGGPHYMISYAVGAATANVCIWIVYYVVLVVQEAQPNKNGEDQCSWKQRFRQAYDRMPEVHLKQLWKPGLCAGLLLTTAMFGSILAVSMSRLSLFFFVGTPLLTLKSHHHRSRTWDRALETGAYCHRSNVLVFGSALTHLAPPPSFSI